MARLIRFPDGFLWGAATSSHQVEGGNRNNWTVWEEANAERLAKEAAVRLPNSVPHWNEIKSAATNPANYISGAACEHFERYEADLDLAKSLNLNAYRFSLEWSRIEPEEGRYDQEAIEHYRRVIMAARQRGLEPFVTLHHFTLPVWLADKGGWLHPSSAHYFKNYVGKAVRELGDEVTFWTTINEPEVYCDMSYLQGAWPPRHRNYFSYLISLHRLISAHKLAYRLIKRLYPAAKIGVSKHNIYFEAYRKGLVNRVLKGWADWSWNFYFLDRVAKHSDFIGLNYYFHARVNFGPGQNTDDRVSDMGWELYPSGIYHVLRGLSRYKLPIYITENGLADAQDRHRDWYLTTVLREIHRAMAGGVDVRGYIHWALIDNFEWSSGFWPRFGLVAVDYSNQKRTIRASALEYAKIVKQNSVEHADTA